MKITFIVITIITTFIATNAAELSLVKAKLAPGTNNKIIFQSTNVTKLNKNNIVKGKIGFQWGLHVFEVAEGEYVCNKKQVCTLERFDRIATYESCKVVKSSLRCSGLLSGSNTDLNNSDVVIERNPDQGDEFPRRDNRDERNDDRVDDEFSDILF